MKTRELELCQIHEWYPRFRRISLKTIILPLPEPYISYLHSDGFFLPRNSNALPPRNRPRSDPIDAALHEDSYPSWSEEDDDTEEPQPISFPDLESDVADSISKLGGSVFPKLNWSAPKDSAWISPSSSLRCTNFGEISLLLKASDSLVHDLCHAFDSCDDKVTDRPQQFFLALRKWYDMRPEMEFRGFVRGGVLVGISQREVTSFYPAVVDAKESLEAAIFQFFLDHLSDTFELEDYTFDCYVTRSGNVKLIDFNPWGAFTLALLFTWEELEGIYVRCAFHIPEDSMHAPSGTELQVRKPMNMKLYENGLKAEFRVVENDCHIQINLRTGGGVPYDYIESGPGSAWDEFLQRASDEVKQQNRDAAAGG